MKSRYPLGIHIAKVNEIEHIYKIEQRCFPGKVGYSKRQIKNLILSPNSTCFIEKQEEKIRAFVIVTYELEFIGHIETIDVDPIFQNKGIGLKLLCAAEIDMIQRGMHWSQLEVSEGNISAQELYKKAGYKIREKIKNYYKFSHNNSRNALRMIKPLQPN